MRDDEMTHGMKRRKEEAEVIVRLDFQDQLAHISVSSWPKMASKMARRYGVSKDGRNTEQSARWTVPLRCISFRALQKQSRPGARAPIPASGRRTGRDSEGQSRKEGI